MARFLGPLRVEEVTDSTWRLTVSLPYESDVLGRLVVVPRNFVTDFASVPRIVPFAFALAGDTAHAAAVVHDFLCSVKSVERRTADAVFYEAMCVTGIAPWRAWPMWAAVRVWAIVMGK